MVAAIFKALKAPPSIFFINAVSNDSENEEEGSGIQVQPILFGEIKAPEKKTFSVRRSI